MLKSTEKTVFKENAFYLDVIEEIMPLALAHEYKFMNDETFAELTNSEVATQLPYRATAIRPRYAQTRQRATVAPLRYVR